MILCTFVVYQVLTHVMFKVKYKSVGSEEKYKLQREKVKYVELTLGTHV